MTINDDVYKDIFSSQPEGKKRYIIIVNDSALHECIWLADYYAMLIEDKEDAARFTDLITTCTTSGEYVREYVFLPALMTKDIKSLFVNELEAYGMTVDKSAWKLFRNKEPTYWTADEVKTVVDKYIESNAGQKEKASLDMVTMDDVEEKSPEWLIMDYIPQNQITTLAGDGGSGKTTLWCAIAAAVSRGEFWYMSDYPFDDEKGSPLKVMYFSAEDSAEYTLKRRLEKNGAVLENIMTIQVDDDRFKNIKFDNPYLEELIKKHRPNLLIFDPIQAFLPPNVKMSERNSMRDNLNHLLVFGKKYGCTIIIVVHSNKRSGAYSRNRIADSADIWDISRSVLMVGETGENGIRYMSHEKSNYGSPAETVLFSIKDDVVSIRGKTTKKDMDFVIQKDYAVKLSPRREEARDFIIDYLKDGEKSTSDLDGMAKAQGISAETLKRAKAELRKESKLKYISRGYGKSKEFYCTLTDMKQMTQ